MDKATGKSIFDMAFAISENLSRFNLELNARLYEMAKNSSPDYEAEEILFSLMKVNRDIYTDILMPIHHLYPDIGHLDRDLEAKALKNLYKNISKDASISKEKREEMLRALQERMNSNDIN